MLTSFGPLIWISDGPEVSFAGFHYPTRMAVIRLAGGGLWVWSPITLTPDLSKQIAALGDVQHIVAPNALHHLALPEWQTAYPQAHIHAAPRLAAKRPDITFASTLSEIAPAQWADQIEQVVVEGNLITTEVVFFHKASGTVIFTDLLQQFPKDFHKGWRAVIAKLDLMVSDEPKVPRKFRTAFVRRSAARGAIAKIKDWPATQVMMAHGPAVTQDAKAFLARAFRWLMKD